MLDRIANDFREFGHLGHDFLLIIRIFAMLGHDAAVVFVCEYYGSVYEVAEDGQQFVIVARLKVGPGEIGVLSLRSDGSQRVTQHILFAGELLNVFVCPHGPVAGGGNLVAFEVEELVGGHVVG